MTTKMPCYEFYCDNCEQTFDRNVPVEFRDYAVCDYCGNGAERVFTPANVVIPTAFGFQRSDFLQTYEQAKAQDLENEEYFRTKPRERPRREFTDVLNEELVKVGERPYVCET